MRKRGLFYLSAAVLAVALLLPSLASAIALTFTGVDPRETVKTNKGGVYAGVYNVNIEDTPFDAFCIDFFHHAPPTNNTIQDYQVKDLSSVFNDTIKADINELLDKNYTETIGDSIKTAALQVALWELTIGDDYNVSTGNFYLQDTSSSFYANNNEVKSQANLYLSQLSSVLGTDYTMQGNLSLVAYTHGTYQNYLTVAPIPEPATLVLVGAGLLGTAAIRRKKKLQK